MKALSGALTAHYAQPYQTVATCWRITLENGTIKGFTDHDQNIVIGEGSPLVGITYLAATGYTASNIVSTAALDTDNLEIQGMLVSPSLLDDELRAGIWDYAAFEIFQVNWADLTQGRNIKRVGKLGEISTGRSNFVAELQGLAKAFIRTIVELTSPSCRAGFGDARCGVDLYPLMVTGVVDDVNIDNMTFYDASRTEPGPAGGYTVDGVLNTNPVLVTVDTPGGGANLINGQAVVISGVVGMEEINAMFVVRNGNLGDPFSAFDIDVDGTGLGAYTGGGLVTPLGAESGYFDFGVVTWLTGLNAAAGRTMEVKQYSPGQITLALPMPYAIQIGDTYSVTPGCDKQLATCRDRYNNIVNMRAEPYLPGIDQIIQIGRRS